MAKDIKAMDICNMYISLYILQEVNIDAHIDKAADRHFYFIKPSPKQNTKNEADNQSKKYNTSLKTTYPHKSLLNNTIYSTTELPK